MLEDAAAKGFAALGNPSRLRIFRLLVQAGAEVKGVPIGFIHSHLDIPLSTLAHHLTALVNADLVSQHKSGREVICRANFDGLDQLMEYLTDNCCVGIDDLAEGENMAEEELA